MMTKIFSRICGWLEQRLALNCLVVAVVLVTPHLVQAQAVSASAAAVSTPAAELKFRDFFTSPIGPRGLQINPSLQAANGQRVRLLGYMVARETPAVGQFFFTPRPLQMAEHADGEADDLPPNTVTVLMPAVDADLPVSHTRGLMQLTGVLQVGRQQMTDGRVSWVRLLLEPPASPPAR